MSVKTRRNGKRAEAVPESQPAIRIRIDRSRLRNRDFIELDRLQRAGNETSYEDMLRFLLRFMVDADDQPVDPEAGWESLMDLTVDETMAAIQSIGQGLGVAMNDAVPPTNAAP